MIIDERTKQDLSRLDYKSGGRIKAVVGESGITDRPVLMIGLGGTGADALLRTKGYIADRLDPNSHEYRQDKIEYLVIDTDRNTGQKEYEGMSLTENEFCYLSYHEGMMPDDVDEWINEGLKADFSDHGITPCRQAVRLMLFQNFSNIMNFLEDKFQRLNRCMEETYRVIVFTGIGGNTGGGLFIDIGYMLKAFLRNKGVHADTYLLAVMPDVNLQRIFPGSSYGDMIKRNGFAALKELEYLNNLKRCEKTFHARYGGWRAEIDTDEPPYGCNLLFSGVDKYNRVIDYNDVINKCTETVISLIADDWEGNLLPTLSTLLPYHIDVMSRVSEENIEAKQLFCSRNYLIPGISSACLPMDDLLSCFTGRILRRMRESWSRTVTREDVDDVIRELGISFERVYNEIKSRVTRRLPELEEFSFEDYKSDNDDIIKQCRAVLERQSAEVDRAAEDLIADLRDKLNDPDNVINSRYFANLEYGPRVTSRMLLFGRKNDPTVTEYCNNVRDVCIRMMPDRHPLEDLEYKVKMAEGIRNASFLDKLNSRKLVRDHSDNIRELFRMYLDDYIYRRMEELYREINAIIREVYNDFYERMAVLTEELWEVCAGYEEIGIKNPEEIGINTADPSWKMINSPEFIGIVEDMMDSDPNIKVRVEDAAEGIYWDFIRNPEKWTSSRNNSVVDHLNGYVSRLFSRIIRENIDTFLARLAARHGSNLEPCYRMIYNQLENEAERTIPERSETGRSFVLSYILIPSYWSLMIDDFRARGRDQHVFETRIYDKIYRLDLMCGITLSDYRYIEEYEEVYENSRNIPGLHLYEGRINWKNLPSPLLSSLWSGKHREYMEHIGLGEMEIIREYDRIFNKAEEYGYIYYADGAAHCLVDDTLETDLKEAVARAEPNETPRGQAFLKDMKEAAGVLKDALHIVMGDDGRECFDLAAFTDRGCDLHGLNMSEGELRERFREYFYRNVGVRDAVKEQIRACELYLELTEKISTMKG